MWVVATRDDGLCLWEVREGGTSAPPGRDPGPETGMLPRISLRSYSLIRVIRVIRGGLIRVYSCEFVVR